MRGFIVLKVEEQRVVEEQPVVIVENVPEVEEKNLLIVPSDKIFTKIDEPKNYEADISFKPINKKNDEKVYELLINDERQYAPKNQKQVSFYLWSYGLAMT